MASIITYIIANGARKNTKLAKVIRELKKNKPIVSIEGK